MKTQSDTTHRTKLLLMYFCGLTAVLAPAFAQTWTKTSAPTNNWSSVALSADGKKVVAVISGSGIYTSTNSGVDWVSNNAPVANWSSVASSADGSKLAALVSGGGIYISTNFGGTWTLGSVVAGGTSIASSADGRTLLVALNNVGVYVSTNSGGTFSKKTVSNSITEGVACSSADGTILMTAAPFGVDISTNAGTTWTSEAGGNYMGETRGAGISAQGNMIFAKADNGIFMSTNYGTVFSKCFNGVPLAQNPSLAISAEGKKVFIVTGTNNIYSSADFGAAWVTNNTPSAFKFIACSADGNTLVAIGNSNIYTSFSAPIPTLNCAALTSNLIFSWLIPSTNLVLQQNLDLTTANWVTLTNRPTLNLTNLHNELIVTPTNDSGFYRLAAP